MDINEFGKVFWLFEGDTQKIKEHLGISRGGAKKNKREYSVYLKDLGYEIEYQKGESSKYLASGLIDKSGERISPRVLPLITEEVWPSKKEKYTQGRITEIKEYMNRIKSLESYLKKTKARTNIIIDSVKDAIPKARYESPPEEKKYDENIEYPKNKEEAVLLISDVHGGRITSSFNPDVLIQRINNLQINVLRIINKILRKSYKIDTLRIHFLGDIADHESLFPGQQFEVQYGVVRQIFSLIVPAFSRMLIELSKHFKNIKIRAVPGNHGRNTKFSDKETNWDLVIYNVLKVNLAAYTNIDWDIACYPTEGQKRDKLFIMTDGPFCLYHGHGIRMYNKTPWYGIEDRFKNLADLFKGTKIYNLGHFHTCFMDDISDKIIIANGTFLSDDDFSIERLGKRSEPRQVLFGYNPTKNKVTWHYRINLDS